MCFYIVVASFFLAGMGVMIDACLCKLWYWLFRENNVCEIFHAEGVVWVSLQWLSFKLEF